MELGKCLFGRLCSFAGGLRSFVLVCAHLWVLPVLVTTLIELISF